MPGQNNGTFNLLWCLCIHRDSYTAIFCLHVVASVRQERDGASVWLSMGFVGSSSALRPRSRRLQVSDFLDCLSRVCLQHPAVSPIPEPSTVVFQVCCGTAISQSSRLSFHLLSLSLSLSPSLSLPSPQQRPRISISAGFFWTAWTHNSTRTAVILICVDSFIRYWQLNSVCSLRLLSSCSHAHAITHTAGHGFSSPLTDSFLQ